METDPGLSQIYDEDTKHYFKNFMEAVLNGEFEELSDVSLFINGGSDANNLSLYLRRRGTVSTENVHQTMRTDRALVGYWCQNKRR